MAGSQIFLNVLLVEDDKDWQNILEDKIKLAINDMGHRGRILVARRLEQALDNIGSTDMILIAETFDEGWQALLKGGPWHLLTTDLMLSQEGREIIKGRMLVQRAAERAVPCVVVTGATQNVLTIRHVVEFFTDFKIRYLALKGEFGPKFTSMVTAILREPFNYEDSFEIFFSYSHQDDEYRDELVKHLSMLRRQSVNVLWHDRKIGAGEEWKNEIDEHLNSARIILLLVSPDFLASDYCYDVEVKRALARHQAGEASVIPVILRSCEWEHTSFGKLQALPQGGTPVKKWKDQDEAFLNVARGIREAVEKLKAH